MIIILQPPQQNRMTAGLWSLLIGGSGLYLAGWLLGPIGIGCGLFGLVASICRLQMGQLLISVLGLVTSVVRVATMGTLAERLKELFEGVSAIVEAQRPLEAAVEETFVNVNPGSTLKLGQARGVVVLAPARAGLPVFEYAANLVKKSVTGASHADKRQIAMMVGRLLPGVEATSDAADALAVAICHAHHRATAQRVEAAL